MLRHFLVIVAIIATTSLLYDANLRLVERQAAATALALEQSELYLPTLKRSLPPPDLSAPAFAVAYRSPQGAIEVLVERGADLPMPIASITKLMTARIANQELDRTQVVKISSADLVWPTDFSSFRINDEVSVDTLLHSLLIESSNYAAAALARSVGEAEFVSAMNREAKKLGLKDTRYYNASGLDPVGLGGDDLNRSTAYDLIRLGGALITDNDLLKISRLPEENIHLANGHFHHRALSTNQLLGARAWPAEILGGKTGQTDLAEKNLILMLDNRIGPGQLIAVVLGARDHFGEMKTLLDWVYLSYDFS